MPLPESLARFNRVVSNRIIRPFARRLPGFGVLRHTGRRSGKVYETPLNVWRDRDRFVVALTYGEDVDWLKNALVSESCEIVIGGETIPLGRPVELATEEGIATVPALVRPVLSTLDVSRFVAFPIRSRN